MREKLAVLVLSSLLLCGPVLAQETAVCGVADLDPERARWIDMLVESYQGKIDVRPVRIPVAFHVITAGTGREGIPASATASSTAAGPAAQNKVRGRKMGNFWLTAQSSSGAATARIASSSTAGRRSRTANQLSPPSHARASRGANATFSAVR